MHTLSHNSYGKSRVRVAKIIRDGSWHTFKDLALDITLHGEMKVAYTAGDNSPVLPTDTMKNTVYALAAQHDLASSEGFALDLSAHFLAVAPQLSGADVLIREKQWKRLRVDGDAHPHAFAGSSAERRTVSVARTRDRVDLSAGLQDLILLKTTHSGFVGFFKEAYTTLPEETDRIFGTNVTASWQYGTLEGVDFNSRHAAVREQLMAVFAQHESLSVQHTLYAMGTAVLDTQPTISQITLSMPNLHNLPVDLTPFGLENANEIFKPVDEPHGTISGTLVRGT